MTRAILILFFGASCCTYAADADTERTGGLWNGREWKTLDNAHKAGYVMGHSDGVSWAVIRLNTPDAWSLYASVKKTGTVLTIGEGMEGIDRFYREFLSVRIPIVYAMEYVDAQFRGDSPAQLASRLKSYRDWARKQE